MEASFWDKGMVPGAYVHVGIESDIFADGLCTQQASQPEIYKQFLRSEVMAREVDKVPEPRRPTAQAAAGEASGPTIVGGQFSTSKSSKVAASGKVPSSMQLSTSGA